MPTVSSPIVVEQRFNRAALGALWARRAELDPGQMMLVKTLYDNRKKGKIEGILRSEYTLSNSIPGRMGYGRMYGSKGSFETLEREIRGTICSEFYHDIDVKNAHPVIMHQYAKRVYAFDMPETRKLCDNRDAYLKLVSANRDEAKAAIISVLYFGKNNFPFLEPWRLEIAAFAKILADDDEHKELMAAIRRQKCNTWGSFLSHILQTEERYIMLAMRDALIELGWSVDVLAYDGVMIRKREDAEVDDDLLRSVEESVAQATEYSIALMNKPFDVLEIEPDGQLIDKVSFADYTARKDEFEKNHFFYEPANSITKVSPNGEVVFYTIEHATEAFNTFDFLHGEAHDFMNRTAFLTLWRKDPKRASYEYIDFQPVADKATYIKPLLFEFQRKIPDPAPVASDNVLPLWNKLLDICSGNRPALRSYITKWFAHILQQPFDLPGVALVLTGPKRCGKDTTANFFMKHVIGDQYAENYGSNKIFFDKHDTGRFNKFVVKLEEANRFQCLHNADELKTFITGRECSVNPKGAKFMKANNYARYIFTSNSGNPLDLEGGERRFVLSPVSGEMVGNHDFWRQVNKELFTAEAGRLVAAELMAVDLNDFNPRQLPENDYQDGVVEESASVEQRFLDAWDGEPVLSAGLFNLYETFCIQNRLTGADNARAFGMRLQALVRDSKLIRKTVTAGTMYRKP